MDTAITLDAVIRDEAELVFSSFSSEDALALGMILADLAREDHLSYAVEVAVNNRIVFHYSMDGARPDNDNWLRRKRNVVDNFFKSSHRVGLELQAKNVTLAYYGLPAEDYSAAGGGFPLFVSGTGCVGCVCVSGLAPEDDHRYVVAGLRKFQEAKQAK